MRKRTWVEVLVSETARLSFTENDKVVAVRVKNQGAATITTGWNSETANNQILANTSDNFDAGDNAYMEGDLTIKFGSGTASAIVLMLKDSPDNCD